MQIWIDELYKRSWIYDHLLSLNISTQTIFSALESVQTYLYSSTYSTFYYSMISIQIHISYTYYIGEDKLHNKKINCEYSFGYLLIGAVSKISIFVWNLKI